MNPTNEVVAYAKTTITFSARKLIGKCGITEADLEDIESEMMLDVLKRLPKHDQHRWSYKTFIPRIVKNKSCHIMRNRCTGKEFFFRGAQSMDAPLKLDVQTRSQPLTLHDIVSSDSLYGICKLSDYEHSELRSDLAFVISNLSNTQRLCCQAIMKGEPIFKIAQAHGIPQSTFYKHVIIPIREAFKDAGLQEYLK